jgi:uncharacterized Zn-binding protein involved in type VI secretion
MPAGFAIRAGDFHVGHLDPKTPLTFHKAPYVATQLKVLAVGSPVVATGDLTTCGDSAVLGSVKVMCGGRPVHRVGDTTSGHAPFFLPNFADVSLTNVKVFVGG